jgi:hypothetical protein
MLPIFFAPFAVASNRKGRKGFAKFAKKGRRHVPKFRQAGRKLLAKKRKTFPKPPLEGQNPFHYERAVIKAQDFNKPFNFIGLHI